MLLNVPPIREIWNANLIWQNHVGVDNARLQRGSQICMKCSPSINFTTRGKTLSLAHCCCMIFFNTYVQHPTVRRRHVRHARCAHTDDDNPASVSQKGKMGGEDECAKEEEVKGGRAKNRWKVGQRGSRHSVCQSVSRGGGGGWWGDT